MHMSKFRTCTLPNGIEFYFSNLMIEGARAGSRGQILYNFSRGNKSKGQCMHLTKELISTLLIYR
jgi:hypothetical protein